MVANTRRTVSASLAMTVIAMGCVGAAQAAPATYEVDNYSFEESIFYPLGSDPVALDATRFFYPGGPNPTEIWNPPASAFPTAGGDGSLPGTAAGAQCFTNAAPFWDQTVVMLVIGTNATIAPNTRYTMTAALGSALTATTMGGDSISFADLAQGALVAEHGDMYPNGLTTNGTGNGNFMGSGTFGDISFSLAANDILGLSVGNGKAITAGDGLSLVLSVGAGACFDNVRLISQNWHPMYGAGTFNWSDSKWSTTSGNGYTGSWTSGQDAVFEGNGGAVTLNTAVTVNSLSFATSDVDKSGSTVASTGSYTLGGTGTITLTGDAVITTGAGTNNNVGEQGDVGPALGTYNNPGGGTNTIACVLAGSAGMYKAGGGALILTAANTYTGGTTVGAGTLQVGNGGTTGSIQGDVQNLANLAFNRSDTFTFDGNISGTGSVDILGSGTTIFTSNHTYTGVTTIHSGTLQIGSGGTTGSIAGDVVNNAALAFNRSDSVTYGGIIYGSGSVTQQGTGRLILTGASSYSGVTNVQSGVLQINGASSAMNVLTNAGGVNVTGGFLVLDYSASRVSVASTVLGLLATAYNGGVNSFHTGQIRDSNATDFGGPIHPMWDNSPAQKAMIEPGPGPSIGLGWVDNPTTHQVTIMPAAYGDANLDGTVGLTDLNTLLLNYGRSGMVWSQGDFNYDGTVGLGDLNMLLGNYGGTGPLNIAGAPYPNLDSQAIQLLAGDGIRFSGVTAVPEPSSLLMLALVLGGAWTIRRQRNRR